MTSSERDVAGDAPAARHAAGPAVRVDPELVVEVLELLVAADGEAGVAAAALPALLDLPGVRGTAVVVRDGPSAVVVGSAGYGCGPMSPGGLLPLDAGLPVTEAVRRRATVVRGAGPGWVALPFTAGRARPGALLLSLDGQPPASRDELDRLERIARAIGRALERAARAEGASSDLTRLLTDLAPPPWVCGDADVVVRSAPWDGPLGGDVVLHLRDGHGAQWGVVADVCGSGLSTAVLARTVHATLAALAPHVAGPAALLVAADGALQPVVGPDGFVTALAVRAQHGRLEVATAGHPAPLVLTGTRATAVPVEPGAPLALATGGVPTWLQAGVDLPPDAVVLLHSDGLLDRRAGGGPRPADAVSLAAGLPVDDLDALADGLLRAADRVGGAGDDVSLLLLRPGAVSSAGGR